MLNDHGGMGGGGSGDDGALPLRRAEVVSAMVAAPVLGEGLMALGETSIETGMETAVERGTDPVIKPGVDGPAPHGAETAAGTGPARRAALSELGPQPLYPARSLQDWRPFLRALAEEIDTVAGPAGRDALLRGVGRQLARLHPVPARDSADGLAVEMNETLDGFGWGRVRIAFSERERCLFLTHEGLPRVGGGGDPPGSWLAGTLVGLYEGWMAQQPGADASLVARRVPSADPDEIVIRYGRE
jgi:hypothetical protein